MSLTMLCGRLKDFCEESLQIWGYVFTVNSAQVLGNAKGAVAVVISILIFRNPVTVTGIAGYTMTVMGVVGYGESKRRYK